MLQQAARAASQHIEEDSTRIIGFSIAICTGVVNQSINVIITKF